MRHNRLQHDYDFPRNADNYRHIGLRIAEARRAHAHLILPRIQLADLKFTPAIGPGPSFPAGTNPMHDDGGEGDSGSAAIAHYSSQPAPGTLRMNRRDAENKQAQQANGDTQSLLAGYAHSKALRL